ncbi:MAG: chorismate lyase [Legionella sp.]|nr:chorismate lyase [Legionella sp.]
MLIKPPRVSELNVNIPRSLLPWVIHQEALTEKLKQSAGDAQLTILNQNWMTSGWWDNHVLGLDRQVILQREILMSAGEHACWYARTIIPQSTYHIHKPIFNRLNHESLGDIIFSEPRIKRYSMINYAITPQCIEYHWLKPVFCDEDCRLWTRLAIFTIDNDSPFFLIEILLPDLYRYCHE